jgi:hypothetical protein
MEPIVLLGLIIVVFGGYVALGDLCSDLGIKPHQRISDFVGGVQSRSRSLKTPVKKMAGMHV